MRRSESYPPKHAPDVRRIPTEPIGSIPRPPDLIQKLAQVDSEDPAIAPFYEDVVRDTIERFEATGSLVVTDGEQRMRDLSGSPA
jgi:methionine synthase II (cobalamin-independent)